MKQRLGKEIHAGSGRTTLAEMAGEQSVGGITFGAVAVVGDLSYSTSAGGSVEVAVYERSVGASILRKALKACGRERVASSTPPRQNNGQGRSID